MWDWLIWSSQAASSKLGPSLLNRDIQGWNFAIHLFDSLVCSVTGMFSHGYRNWCRSPSFSNCGKVVSVCLNSQVLLDVQQSWSLLSLLWKCHLSVTFFNSNWKFNLKLQDSNFHFLFKNLILQWQYYLLLRNVWWKCHILFEKSWFGYHNNQSSCRGKVKYYIFLSVKRSCLPFFSVKNRGLNSVWYIIYYQ